MSEWHEIAVRDLCVAIVDCVNKTAPAAASPTPYKMLRTTNVRGGWVDTANVRHVSQETYERWTRRMKPQRGDIILTREAPLGEVGLLRSDDDVFLGQRLVMYRADPRFCDNRFLMYSMLGPTVQAELRRLGSGATVEHLRVPDCEKLTILCPSLETQVRIGQTLGELDDLIENNRRRIELLESMARAIYREWFVRLRFPGHENVDVVNSDLGFIPEGWRARSISELSTVVTRGIAPKYADNGPWTVLNQKCIRDERVSFGASRRQERQVPEAKRVRFGDVLINSTGVGTLGRVALYRHRAEYVTVDSHVTIARPVERSLNPWYGFSLLARQADFERLGSGSTGQTELSRGDIGATLVAVPGGGLLAAFADSTWPLLNEVDALIAYNDNLAGIRDLLLPKLVTGEIDVSALDVDFVMGEAVA